MDPPGKNSARIRKPVPVNLLNAAKKYMEKGMCVVPLKDKYSPYLSASQWQKERSTPADVEAWWHQWPDALVGIACGSPSGGLIVVDIDDPDWSERLKKTDLLGRTTVVETPHGGLHIYVHQETGLECNRGLIGGVGDIKGEGSYVAAPPSLGYHFLSQKKPVTVHDAWEFVLGFVPELRTLSKEAFNVLSYNVQHCRGGDDRVMPLRVAEVIKRNHADITALQEVDFRCASTGMVDQAEAIAEEIKMEFAAFPVLERTDVIFGNVIFSRFPMTIVKKEFLPQDTLHPHSQPRGALWVEILLEKTRLQVINTHLSVVEEESRVQMAALLGPDWIGAALRQGPVLFCGDLNFQPSSQAYLQISSVLRDTQRPGHAVSKPTWPAARPEICIDYIFADKKLGILGCDVPANELEKSASDHLPLLAKIRI